MGYAGLGIAVSVPLKYVRHVKRAECQYPCRGGHIQKIDPGGGHGFGHRRTPFSVYSQNVHSAFGALAGSIENSWGGVPITPAKREQVCFRLPSF